MTPPEQQPTAEAIAAILSQLDTPRQWTVQPIDAENWQHYTPLVSSDGLEFHFHETPRDKKRWSVSMDFGPLDHFKHRDEYDTAITCAKSKDAATLARDIYRRMVGPARKLRSTLIKRRRDEMDKAEHAQHRAMELCAAASGYLEILRRDDNYSRDEINLYMNRSTGAYLSAKVNQYNEDVHFERMSMTHELAKRVMVTIAEYLKERGNNAE